MSIKLSVVTVCKNAKSTIEDCIASVRSQTYGSLEHIIVDGGSTDGTLERLRAYRRESGRNVLLVTEPDHGTYDAMNKGILHSSGDVVCFLNADDFYLHRSAVAWLVEILGLTPCDYVCGQTFILNEFSGSSLLTQHRNVTRFYLFKRSLSQPSTFFRRRVFDRTGLFDLSYRIASDYEWFLRSLLKSHDAPYFCPVTTTVLRTGGVSTAPSFKRKLESEIESIRGKYFGRWERFLYQLAAVDFALDYEWMRVVLARRLRLGRLFDAAG